MKNQLCENQIEINEIVFDINCQSRRFWSDARAAPGRLHFHRLWLHFSLWINSFFCVVKISQDSRSHGESDLWNWGWWQINCIWYKLSKLAFFWSDARVDCIFTDFDSTFHLEFNRFMFYWNIEEIVDPMENQPYENQIEINEIVFDINCQSWLFFGVTRDRSHFHRLWLHFRLGIHWIIVL